MFSKGVVGDLEQLMGITRLKAFAPSLLLILALFLVFALGCSSNQAATPEPGTGVSKSGATATPFPTSTAPARTIEPTKTVVSTPPSPSPAPALEPLLLHVPAPVDESGVEVGFVRVMGSTSGSSVTVNGLVADLLPDGEFRRDISLRDGVNLIEVVALDDAGQAASQQIVVFLVSPTAGLPFTLLHPLDGLEVSEPMIDVVGVTRPDTVIGVNDIPVEVNGSGIFSTTIALEEGPNLLEVVAADIEGNVRFQTSVVFFLP